MKKILLLLVITSFLSCDIGDDGPNFESRLMSIESVDTPDEFIFGEVHEITVNYTRPNSCYEFNNFILQSDGNTRTIAVVDNVYSNATCTQATEVVSVSFDFSVLSMETYIFQFYQGEDENGESQYLIVEIPVAE